MQFSFGVNFPAAPQGGEGGGSPQLSAESSPEISGTSLDVNGVITVTTWPTWNLPGVTTTVEFDYFNGSQWTNLGSFPGDALVLTVDLIATSVRARVIGHLNDQSASTTSNEISTNTARAPSIANNWGPEITLSGLVGTCSPGTWIGNPTPLEAPLSVTPTYQWQSDASGSFLDISGATTPTLSIGYNLSVRCQVTVFDYSNIAHSAYSNTIFIPET